MIRRMAFSALRRAAAGVVRLRRRDFLAVFNYHQVSPQFDPKYHIRYTWTPLQHFEKQILELKRRFKIVRLPDAIKQLKDGSLRGPCAAITLDDGDISIERYVTPFLKKHRIPATYFINSGYWGRQKTYWVFLVGHLLHNGDERKRAVLGDNVNEQFAMLRNTKDPQRYRQLRDQIESFGDLVDFGEQLFVSKEFLAGLDPELFSIALHGHEHQRFSMMPEQWQRDSIKKNMEHLQTLPCYCPIFGVPFGRPHDWDDTVLRICKELSLDVAFANGGINWPGSMYCERMPADGSKVSSVFRQNLVGW